MVVDMCNRCDSIDKYFNTVDNADRRSDNAKKISRDISKYIGDIVLSDIDDLLWGIDVIDRCATVIDNDNLPLTLSPNRQGFSNQEIDHLLSNTWFYIRDNISRLIKRYESRKYSSL